MRNSVCDSVTDPPHQTGPDPLTSVGEITSESGRGYSHDGTPRDRAPLVVGVRDVTDVGNSFLLSSFIFPLHYPSVSRPTARRPLSAPPSVVSGVPRSRRKLPPPRGPSPASVTPAATGAAVAAVGLLLQVVERVYHVLQTVHVVPAKRTNSLHHLNIDLGLSSLNAYR